MRIIGLTGGIACGKSTLSQALRDLGAPVIDADEISHCLTAPGGAALPAIREAFGGGVFDPEGNLDRRKLGGVIFSDGKSRQKLNDILHPLIFREMEERTQALERRGVPAVIWDIPLLFESGMEGRCGQVWCASLPQEEQLRRLINRDGLSRQQALNRINSQMPLDEKRRRSDVVIDTSGTVEQSAASIQKLYMELIQA